MPRVDRQLAYIESCSSPLPSLSSLLSLVSSISAIYKADYSAFCTCRHNKSQGLTLPKVILNLNQKEHCLGLSYVAVSRVKTLNSLLFEVPFDFEHFTGTNSAVFRDRELDYTCRNAQLL
jgi:hypothetical protein